MDNSTENSQVPTAPQAPAKTDRQLLEEIHKFSRQTKNYMMWQMIITIALVVLPLIGALVLIPYTFRTLSSAYGLDSLGGNGSTINISPSTASGLLNQLKDLQK